MKNVIFALIGAAILYFIWSLGADGPLGFFKIILEMLFWPITAGQASNPLAWIIWLVQMAILIGGTLLSFAMFD